jgi:hypothetical protein
MRETVNDPAGDASESDEDKSITSLLLSEVTIETLPEDEDLVKSMRSVLESAGNAVCAVRLITLSKMSLLGTGTGGKICIVLPDALVISKCRNAPLCKVGGLTLMGAFEKTLSALYGQKPDG